ncbi:MAG: class 1 fructose-bisphosphatase [Deltaproteobacteria bacterium]|nr:class 1 fructose-bisphosphatase [Deltaproteobacteria bacterium]MBW2306109.1 class 1 fructose-bisphosphatase [Deltaproteobacteria bacterium]
MLKPIMTISRYILEQQIQNPGATGRFSGLLTTITLAAKVIAREVRKSGLLDILGKTGDVNVQGEQVTKLDEFSHKVIMDTLGRSGHVCALASEEEESIIEIPEGYPLGRYVLLLDPLDGSSNIDVNVSVGTIFSIHRRITREGKGMTEDFLQPGHRQVGAGYVVYGSSTMMVYSTGQGVHGFTLDPEVGEFLLSHENIRMPEKGKIYSINEGYHDRWERGVDEYIHYLKREDKETDRPYSSRYIGTLVADFHRTLLYGGIFLYPSDRKRPHGKLRLLYEAAPMAYLAEQAGGLAITGRERILDIQPTSLHQRIPLIIGSRQDVLTAEKFIRAAS